MTGLAARISQLFCRCGAADYTRALFSGAKTGRSPRDKRVVAEPSTERDIWWASTSKGSPNFVMDER